MTNKNTSYAKVKKEITKRFKTKYIWKKPKRDKPSHELNQGIAPRDLQMTKGTLASQENKTKTRNIMKPF
jgi:hypothetical protein